MNTIRMFFLDQEGRVRWGYKFLTFGIDFGAAAAGSAVVCQRIWTGRVTARSEGEGDCGCSGHPGGGIPLGNGRGSVDHLRAEYTESSSDGAVPAVWGLASR